LTEERIKAKKPRMYKVILHNDDFTTMEFVIDILMNLFRKSHTEATKLMFDVHYKGACVAGVYTREIAETKADQVIQYARKQEHPFMATVEPA